MRIPHGVAGLVPLVLLVLAGGCLQSDSTLEGPALTMGTSGEAWVEAWDPVGPPSVPTVTELDVVLGLSEEQARVAEGALTAWQAEMETWRAAMQARMHDGRPGPPPGGHGLPGGFGEFEPPMLAFLETLVPVLDAEQVGPLAHLLAEKRDQRPPHVGDDGHGHGGPGHEGGHHGGGIGMGPHGDPGMFLGRILARIDGLTAEQIEQIRIVLEGARPEFHDLRIAFVAGTISAEELRDRARALRERIEASLRSILDVGQFAALEAAIAEHRAEMASRRLATLAQGVARRLEFLAKVLGLTAEQKAMVAAVLEESVAARRAVLEALRDGTIEIEDALYQGYVIATRTANAIRALLTPEQAAILDALKRLLPGHCAP